jgi:hypothetical protein
MNQLIISDDIRHYDPLLWEKIKNKSLVIKEKVEKKFKKLKEPKEPKEPKQPKEKTDRKEYKREYYKKNKEKINNQKNYLSSGKEWYHKNKERLKKMREQRELDPETKKKIARQKYIYLKQYYNINKDLLNQKRREKYRLEHPPKEDTKEKNYDQIYYQNNKERILKGKKEYYKNKISNNNIE